MLPRQHYYFLIQDSSVELLDSASIERPVSAVVLSCLNEDHRLAPIWDAVGIRAMVVDRGGSSGLQIRMPVEPICSLKKQMYDIMKLSAQESYGRDVVIECAEMASRLHPESVGFETFSRDVKGNWEIDGDVSLQSRALQAKGMLGLPGGPCHIIRDIEEERLSPKLKKELIEDIEKGKDLSNANAHKLYKPVSIQVGDAFLRTIKLTAHAQYRMNLRGVTVAELKLAFDEFRRWYAARKVSDKPIKPKDNRLMQSLAYGEPVRFDAKKLALTVVFAWDDRKREAVLVSCWWTNTPTPPKPTPGQCDFLPYLDKIRTTDRPAILGALESRLASMVSEVGTRLANLTFEESWHRDYADGSFEGVLVSRSGVVDSEETEEGTDSEETEVEAGPNGNRYYRNRAVSPRNRQKNRERRLKYKRQPTQRRLKRRQQKLYDRKPGTKRLRKRQIRLRKIRRQDS